MRSACKGWLALLTFLAHKKEVLVPFLLLVNTASLENYLVGPTELQLHQLLHHHYSKGNKVMMSKSYHLRCIRRKLFMLLSPHHYHIQKK